MENSLLIYIYSNHIMSVFCT